MIHTLPKITANRKPIVVLLAGFSLLVICFWLSIPFLAHAADTVYQPLEEVKGLTSESGTKGVGIKIVEYLPNIVKFAIGLASALAVIYLIIGGFQYMSSDAIFAKEEGKKRIYNAIGGLLLAISSVVILNTISPKLVKINLDIKGVETKYTPDETTPAGPGQAWPSDSGERGILSGIAGELIAYNRGSNNCATIGESDCTSIYKMHNVVLLGLGNLAKNCNCKVTITGGTEFWKHGSRQTDPTNNSTPHKPSDMSGSRPVADISLDSPELNSFLRSRGTRSNRTDCAPGSERYSYGGGLFVNEQILGNDPHWHVCYY